MISTSSWPCSLRTVSYTHLDVYKRHNLIAVLLLSGVIAKETRHYLKNLDEVDTTEIPVVDK